MKLRFKYHLHIHDVDNRDKRIADHARIRPEEVRDLRWIRDRCSEESDKSQFLTSAGYALADWEVLERDLRRLIRDYEISGMEVSPYGIKYEVHGSLTGPNGRTLHIVTVWIKLEATSEVRFVTLLPDKR